MRSTKGFTLAEMLIALVLVGVIAAMVIPKLLLSTGSKSAVSKVQSAASTLESALTNIDPTSTAGNYVAYTNATLNGAVATTAPAGGCTAGNAALNESTYITLKGGTLIALGTGTSTYTQGPLALTSPTGVIGICIDPSPGTGSIGYYGEGVLTSGSLKFEWGPTAAAAKANIWKVLGTGAATAPTASVTVRTLASTL